MAAFVFIVLSAMLMLGERHPKSSSSFGAHVKAPMEEDDTPAMEIASGGRFDAPPASVTSAELVDEDRSDLPLTGFDLEGRVIDESGTGLAGLKILKRRANGYETVGASGRGGAFVARSVGKGDYLAAQGSGFVCVRGYQVSGLETATIVCERGVIVEGVVLDASGAPVEEARVALKPEVTDILRSADGTANSVLVTSQTFSDAHGRFELGFTDREALRVLTVGLDGTERLRIELSGPPPEFLELRLPPADSSETAAPTESASIAGRVREQDGTPLVGWFVQVFPRGESMDLLQSKGSAQTDDDGRFELTELAKSEYTLVGFDPQSLRRTSDESVAAGDHDVLLIPEGATSKRLVGFVRAPDGTPLQGVKVSALPHGVSADAIAAYEWVPRTSSNALGSFEFAEDIDRQAHLKFWGVNVATADRAQDDAVVDAQGIPTYYIDRLCPVRVHFSAHPDGEIVEFRDRHGIPLTAELRTANLRLRLVRLPWTGTPIIEALVPEGASSFTVFRGSKEVSSRPIVLNIQQTTEVTTE